MQLNLIQLVFVLRIHSERTRKSRAGIEPAFQGVPSLAHDRLATWTLGSPRGSFAPQAFSRGQEAEFEEVGEGVWVFAVIELVTGFADVKMRVLAAVMVVLSVPRALQERPEVFDVVGVGGSLDESDAVVDVVVGHQVSHVFVAGEVVGHQNRSGHVALLLNVRHQVEARKRLLCKGLGFDAPFSLRQSHDGQFVCAASSFFRGIVFPVGGSWFAAEVSFVHFDDAAEKAGLLEIDCL